LPDVENWYCRRYGETRVAYWGMADSEIEEENSEEEDTETDDDETARTDSESTEQL
jgi:hypothetical protein